MTFIKILEIFLGIKILEIIHEPYQIVNPTISVCPKFGYGRERKHRQKGVEVVVSQ
jgi:hypothetical protein